MRYFVDPVKYALSKELFALKTEKDRDEFQPQASVEVAEIPADYSPTKYKYNFETDTWEIEDNYEYTVALRKNTRKRGEAMKLAIRQSQHWDMMDDAEQAVAWRGYYRELYALEQAPGWPLVDQWPEAPQ